MTGTTAQWPWAHNYLAKGDDISNTLFQDDRTLRCKLPIYPILSPYVARGPQSETQEVDHHRIQSKMKDIQECTAGDSWQSAMIRRQKGKTNHANMCNAAIPKQTTDRPAWDFQITSPDNSPQPLAPWSDWHDSTVTLGAMPSGQIQPHLPYTCLQLSIS